MAEPLQIARGIVDVWAAPGCGVDDDRLTQALLGCPAIVLAERDGWARVRLPDYEGWVERGALAQAPDVAAPEALVVTARGAPLYAEPAAAAPRDEIYLGTVLPLAGAERSRAAGGERIAVLLPGGAVGWAPAGAGERRTRAALLPPRPAAHAVVVARQFLGCPYLWGGVTYRGIDCSALVQRAYALSGYVLPRDADQQWAALPTAVERDALAPGDLLFFARDGAVVHVALALDATTFIHALGDPPRGVCVDSLDPTAPSFNARLAALYLGARRVVP
jgi:cell wall-associated NlpC family hydrolase